MGELGAVIVGQSAEPETTRTEILRIVRRAKVSARKPPEWRTAPFEAVAHNQLMTATLNFERVPSILLDLRWRVWPAVLRIGVGIGEISAPVTRPPASLEGRGVELARRALGELITESATTRRLSLSDLQRVSGTDLSAPEPKPSARAAGSVALTRFCTVSSDFDEIVNALYRPLDTLVLAMSTNEQKHSCKDTREGLDAIEVVKAAAATAPTSRTRFLDEHVARNSQIAGWGELLTATAGIEQLIAERFYAAFHDYKE